MQKTKNVIPSRTVCDAALSLYFTQPRDDFHVAHPDALNHGEQRTEVWQQRGVDDRPFIQDHPTKVERVGWRLFGGEQLRTAFLERRVRPCITRSTRRAGRRLAWRRTSLRRTAAVTPSIQGVLLLFSAGGLAVRLDPFVRLPRAMKLRAAKGTAKIFPASVVWSRQKSNATIAALFDTPLK